VDVVPPPGDRYNEAMTADDPHTSKPKRRWFQYRLRTLLALAVLGALVFPLVARWVNRPWDESLSVKLTAQGDVFFGGESIDLDKIQPILAREAGVFKQFGLTPVMIIEADARASTRDVQRLIEVAQKAGFEKFALRAASDPMPEK